MLSCQLPPLRAEGSKNTVYVVLLIYLVFVVLTLVLLPLWLFEWQLETVPKCCCEIRALFRTANILAEFPGIDW